MSGEHVHATQSPTIPHVRLRDEPSFVLRKKPQTREQVFDEPTQVPPPRARWPATLLLLLMAGSAAAAIAIIWVSRGSAVAIVEPRDRIASADAAVVVPVAADATPPDAPLADASELVVVATRDAAAPTVRPRHDAGEAVAITPNGRGTIQIQVLTKPEGAVLKVNGAYRGPGGTSIEEPFGRRLTVACSLTGYEPGKVDLVFDGKSEVALCVLKRIKRCIDGIKNPFDDCETGSDAP